MVWPQPFGDAWPTTIGGVQKPLCRRNLVALWCPVCQKKAARSAARCTKKAARGVWSTRSNRLIPANTCLSIEVRPWLLAQFLKVVQTGTWVTSADRKTFTANITNTANRRPLRRRTCLRRRPWGTRRVGAFGRPGLGAPGASSLTQYGCAPRSSLTMSPAGAE
jgi:hypothetical protein